MALLTILLKFATFWRLMKISLIGQTTGDVNEHGIESRTSEMATRFVRAGHRVTVYSAPSALRRKLKRYNGFSISYLYGFAAVLHAAFIVRTDVFHLISKQSQRFKHLCRMVRPGATVVTEALPEGVTIRRVTTDDIVLSSYGLRSGSFAVALTSSEDEDIPEITSAWDRAYVESPNSFNIIQLAVINEQELSQSTRKAVFAGARFVVLPKSEHLRALALEAMSYGRATVVPHGIIEDERMKDFAASYKEEQDLKKTITELVEDPMIAASIGHASREFIETEYSWDNMALNLLNQYRQSSPAPEGVYIPRG